MEIGAEFFSVSQLNTEKPRKPQHEHIWINIQRVFIYCNETPKIWTKTYSCERECENGVKIIFITRTVPNSEGFYSVSGADRNTSFSNQNIDKTMLFRRSMCGPLCKHTSYVLLKIIKSATVRGIRIFAAT